MPFWPGGLDDVLADDLEGKKSESKDVNGLRTVPPGFSRGLRLAQETVGDEEIIPVEVDVLQFAEHFDTVRNLITLLFGTVPRLSRLNMVESSSTKKVAFLQIKARILMICFQHLCLYSPALVIPLF